MRLFELYERKIFIFLLWFLCSFISQSCIKEYSLENGSTTGLATGTLKDASNNCLFTSVHGNFYKGFAAQTNSTFLELGVNVTQPGYYRITTDLQNGFKFADSGFFTNIGLHTILLKPVGTPVTATTSNFSIRFDSSVCNIAINVLDSIATSTGGGTTTAPVDPDSLANNSWIFTANKQTYSGPITTAHTAGPELSMSGPTRFSPDTLFILTVRFLVTLNVGIYKTSDVGTTFVLDKTAGSNQLIYRAGALNPQQLLTINITKYDEATKTVSGIFYGNSLDVNNNPIPITNGAFKAIVL